MGWYCGVRCRSVTIRPGRGCQGWVWFCRSAAESVSPAERLEHTVLIHLAGPLAAWPFERRFRAVSARRDLECAYGLVSGISCSPEEAIARLSRLKEQAWNTLGQEPLWKAVNAVAEALVKHATLTGREVRAIIAHVVEGRELKGALAPSSANPLRAEVQEQGH
jgi:hypothetical protein